MNSKILYEVIFVDGSSYSLLASGYEYRSEKCDILLAQMYSWIKCGTSCDRVPVAEFNMKEVRAIISKGEIYDKL